MSIIPNISYLVRGSLISFYHGSTRQFRMLLLSLILYLFHIFSNTNAVPLSVIPDITIQQCTCPDQRTIWDIIWSCLVTIFSCCWVSVHPNMPGPDDSLTKKALRRLKLMLWSIFAPEGGFMLYDRDTAIGILGPRQLEDIFTRGKSQYFWLKRRLGWPLIHNHYLLLEFPCSQATCWQQKNH